jgi:Fe-S cluster assembly ATP-binding protein
MDFNAFPALFAGSRFLHTPPENQHNTFQIHTMLEIKDLKAEIEGQEILKGVSLTVKPGEVHAIMGPNGSGKSTLASVLAGREDYEVTGGEVTFEGDDLLDMEPDERARAGLFLAFQYPVELPGVSQSNFLRQAVNSVREERGEGPLSAVDFLSMMREKAALVDLDPALMSRSVNENFSGGEKKRNEIFQLAMLDPKLAILDETDSGLDIDALRVVADGVNALRSSKRSFLLITHYQRLLNYIVPDRVHVLVGGRIVRSGGKELALELEEKGYDWIREEVAV